MEGTLWYRGRRISADDIGFIRDLLANNPKASRRALSEKLCEAWNWRQANGELSAMVCRGLMLKLHRAGHIELPPVRWVNPNPLGRRAAQRGRPAPMLIDTTVLSGRLKDIQPIEIEQVRRTGQEGLFDSLIERYHYLGYSQPVGEHLKYLVHALNRPIACLAWSSAPRHLGPRDRFIGWSPRARRANIRFLAYNTRFLILPFVQVPHLASHLLGRMARLIAADWEELYRHPVYYLETFIDPERFAGTCYRAANWVLLGETTGRGKDAPRKEANRSIKQVLGYPLRPDFREKLSRVESAS
jgi:hypothetical protein